ncbi:hypothetical protein [Flavobacterium psychrolimnae]|uniref:hypothetical protein n=1 Tax=Flavobacterium psychrolimnae TaxID=249351 RepID=UPI00142D931D|nr:hypothetical protein [Flavobacterium psychrolimnae]
MRISILTSREKQNFEALYAIALFLKLFLLEIVISIILCTKARVIKYRAYIQPK